MRISVTVTDEMNKTFDELAKKQKVSKDKFCSKILLDWCEDNQNDYKALYNKALEEIERLKESKHNERGAGRKKTITQEEIDNIFYLFTEQGLSMRAIGRQVGYSVTMISHILNGKVK